MTPEAFTLVRLDHDYNKKENDGVKRTVLGIFVDAGGKFAWQYCDEYLKRMEQVQPYLGASRQIFPQFYLEKQEINPLPNPAG